MLEFIETRKQYGNQRVLQIPYLMMPSGSSWLHGANGSGKTTLLNMVAGLIPFSGHILLNEISLRRSPVAYRRCVAWAAAEPQFPGFMRGQELLAYFVAVRKANTARWRPGRSASSRNVKQTGYQNFFSRFIISEHKALYLALKIGSGAVLAFLVRAQSWDPAEMKMPLVLFSVVIFGHGIILHAWRDLEREKMAFLPGLPYTWIRRWAQFAGNSFLLLSPEILLLIIWTPHAIPVGESILFMSTGYGLILLLGSLLYIGRISRSDYLKLTGSVYFVFFLTVLAGVGIWMAGVFLMLSLFIFFRGYYRYQ